MDEILKVKGLQLKQKILQSPMAGCTDLAFRRIARQFGCELAFTEMVKDRPVIDRNERTQLMLSTEATDHPLGMQLVGREPKLLAEAAKCLEGLGADVIDLNLGCPVPKVVNNGCGAALLKEPEQVGRILDAMVPAVQVPVTIKMRTGFDEGDTGRFLHVARIASEHGAGAITAHGRTRKQGYTGLSNLEAIRAVKEVATIPVIGNGDIRSGRDAERMFRETGCDGVMLARGTLGNPWIYREVAQYLATGAIPPAPGPAERALVLKEHFAHLRELYGNREALLRVRRVIHWFVKGATNAAVLRQRGNSVASPEEVFAIADEFARSQPMEESAPEPAEA